MVQFCTYRKVVRTATQNTVRTYVRVQKNASLDRGSGQSHPPGCASDASSKWLIDDRISKGTLVLVPSCHR
jgi:hypothetical protein